MPQLTSAYEVREAEVRLRPSEVAEYTTRASVLFLRECVNLIGVHRPSVGHVVPQDFVGVCVATSPDAACDAYVLDRLRDAGIQRVRLDFTYGSGARHTARLLDTLLDNDIHVLLHLVQPFDEAHAMNDTGAQERWRAFVKTTLEQWGDRIDAVEIGSTINRRKWAYYTPDAFMLAWGIAHDVARDCNVTIAGPNVTDFDPACNVMFLQRMKTAGNLPDVHTDNLFAERAVEPERYDGKIVGRALASIVKCNLVKKARALHHIAETVGVQETWSTHVAWSKRRIDRVLADVREKQADYLARYYLLGAVSGALERVYWGPLIGQREGVIDDGTDEYPVYLPHVTIYEQVFGEVADYTVCPGLHAMKTFARLIPGLTYDGPLSELHGLEAHAFSGERGVVHALWTIDGRGAELESLYSPEDLVAAEWIDRDGATLDEPPGLITESPVYATWPTGRAIKAKNAARTIPRLTIHEPTHVYREDEWRGAVVAASAAERDRLLAVIGPTVVKDAARRETLREARNTVWRIDDPLNRGESLVVKRWLLKPLHKRVLDRFKPSKARRSWNGANELLRRGIGTPRPVAYFEHATNGVLKENFYVCGFTTGGLTVRSFFTAYATGEDAFEGVSARDFYEKYADFLLNMHRRGVHYRDMSPGNILVEMVEDGELRFSMVDTARARFFERPASVRQSLTDLKRTCHPLHWEGRKEFVGIYLEKRGEAFTSMRQLPFALYDLKQRFKRKTYRVRRLLTFRSPAGSLLKLSPIAGHGALASESLAAFVGVI